MCGALQLRRREAERRVVGSRIKRLQIGPVESAAQFGYRDQIMQMNGIQHLAVSGDVYKKKETFAYRNSRARA